MAEENEKRIVKMAIKTVERKRRKKGRGGERGRWKGEKGRRKKSDEKKRRRRKEMRKKQ